MILYYCTPKLLKTVKYFEEVKLEIHKKIHPPVENNSAMKEKNLQHHLLAIPMIHAPHSPIQSTIYLWIQERTRTALRPTYPHTLDPIH